MSVAVAEVQSVVRRYVDVREKVIAARNVPALRLDRIRINGHVVSLSNMLAWMLQVEMAGNATDQRLRRPPMRTLHGPVSESLYILSARMHGRTQQRKTKERDGTTKVDLYARGIPWEDVADFVQRPVHDVKRQFKDAQGIMAEELKVSDSWNDAVPEDASGPFTPTRWTQETAQQWFEGELNLPLGEFIERLRVGLFVAVPREV